jgi:integrase
MNGAKSTPPKRRTNKESRAREHLTDDEVDRLRKAAAKMGNWGHRNATLILIGYRHGLRVSELLDLRWENVDLVDKTVYVTRLKDSKPGVHTMERDELTALRKLNPRPSGLVFLSERGGALSRRTICHIVAQAGIAAGLPFPVHPHMLRHTCGYGLANRGHDTRMIQDWLGHRQIQHTVKYTELDPERFRRAGMWSKRRA